MSSKMNHRQRAGKSSRPPRRGFRHHDAEVNPDGPTDPIGQRFARHQRHWLEFIADEEEDDGLREIISSL